MNLINQKYGKLFVVQKSNFSKKNNIMWDCLCDCGNKTKVSTANLNSGRVRSCGCLKSEKLSKRNITHNQRHSHLYEVWKSMKQRCYNPKLKSYKNYGGRGIKICEPWYNDFQAFYDWAYANGYSTKEQQNETKKLTIDRIDNNGNYTPDNCRWVTRKQQASNLRTTKLVTIKGETKCVADWCREYNIHRSTYDTRIRKGMPPEEALTK